MRKRDALLGGHPLTVEMAVLPEDRKQGLSNRARVPDGTGMLFLFPKPGLHSFWMKDTSVPLVIYWLDAQGVVVDRASLTPFSLESVAPNDYALFALEVPLTWAARKRVGIGDRFTFA
jgi:uncharacterized membrane protein (UPF0127 family)